MCLFCLFLVLGLVRSLCWYFDVLLWVFACLRVGACWLSYLFVRSNDCFFFCRCGSSFVHVLFVCRLCVCVCVRFFFFVSFARLGWLLYFWYFDVFVCVFACLRVLAYWLSCLAVRSNDCFLVSRPVSLSVRMCVNV